MGFLGRVKEHFKRRVVYDNRGFLESILPMLGQIAGSAGGKAAIGAGTSFGLSKLFGGGGGIEIEDMRTPEQKEAARILQQLGTTGSAAGINLGEAYGGSLGDFTPTGQEQLGLSQLFNQQPNAALGQAQDVFGQLSGAAFDPSVLEPFRKAAVRSEGQALDRLSQSKAATGSRFGTGFGRDASSLVEGTELGIQQQLANLFQSQQGVSLAGAQGLAGVGGQQAALQQQQLGNLFGFGSLERDIGNQKAQNEFNEFNRQRSEELGRIDLLSTEANRNPFLGVSSLPEGQSGLSSLINSALGGLGENAATAFGEGGFKGLFGFGK